MKGTASIQTGLIQLLEVLAHGDDDVADDRHSSQERVFLEVGSREAAMRFVPIRRVATDVSMFDRVDEVGVRRAHLPYIQVVTESRE